MCTMNECPCITCQYGGRKKYKWAIYVNNLNQNKFHFGALTFSNSTSTLHTNCTAFFLCSVLTNSPLLVSQAFIFFYLKYSEMGYFALQTFIHFSWLAGSNVSDNASLVSVLRLGTGLFAHFIDTNKDILPSCIIPSIFFQTYIHTYFYY